MNQTNLEKSICIYLDDVKDNQAEQINGMLGLSFCSCSYDKKKVMLSFTPDLWMKNTDGILHGGVSASLLDVAMGMLVRTFTESKYAMTTSLNVNYLHPVMMKAELLVEASIIRIGSQICVAEGIIRPAYNDRKILVQATGNFFIFRHKKQEQTTEKYE